MTANEVMENKKIGDTIVDMVYSARFPLLFKHVCAGIYGEVTDRRLGNLGSWLPELTGGRDKEKGHWTEPRIQILEIGGHTYLAPLGYVHTNRNPS